MSTIPTTRRNFCACCAKSAAFLAAGSMTACGGGPTGPSSNATPLPQVSATVAGRQVTVAIGSTSPLATPGGMAMAQTSIGSFLVTRTGTGTVSVLTATCTHEGCTVNGMSMANFVCPCHGSAFSTSGSVVAGPATRPLQQFAAQLADGTVTFTA